jgi:hypothetical protein
MMAKRSHSPSLSMRHNSDKPSEPVPNCLDEPVAALCVSGRSVYKYLPGVVAFDERRDARTFGGYMPVVVHPPCRYWSPFVSALACQTTRTARIEPEKRLGLWCVEQVRQWGGVLEHPAGSRLFAAAGLPLPGRAESETSFTIYLEQNWFGYGARKATWVYVCGVPRAIVPGLPFNLATQDGFDFMAQTKAQRSRTMQPLAQWFVSIARSVWRANSDLQNAITPAEPCQSVRSAMAA